LQREVAEIKVCDGVDLAKARVADAWQVDKRMVTCGDWRLVLDEPTADAFRLVWDYEYIPPKGEDDGLQKSIVMECARIERGRFLVKSIHRVENKLVILIP